MNTWIDAALRSHKLERTQRLGASRDWTTSFYQSDVIPGALFLSWQELGTNDGAQKWLLVSAIGKKAIESL
jgi:hypothetical protein